MCDLIKEEKHNEFHCLYWVMKSYGNICLAFKDLNAAKQVFLKMKHECEDNTMYKHKMAIYKQLGYVYRLLAQHQKACSCFKKCLQLAWYFDDVSQEMSAYANLAIDNFYLGLMDKAAYYDRKFKNGECEEPQAVIRRAAVGIIKNRIQDKVKGRQNMKRVNGKRIKTGFDKMPSPCSFGGAMSMKFENTNSLGGQKKRSSKINKEEYKDCPRQRKPFADFKMEELIHLNIPEV